MKIDFDFMYKSINLMKIDFLVIQESICHLKTTFNYFNGVHYLNCQIFQPNSPFK